MFTWLDVTQGKYILKMSSLKCCVVDAKIIFGYNFVAPFNKTKLHCK